MSEQIAQDQYKNNCEILKRKGYVFDNVRNEWVKKNKYRQIKISDDAVKQSASFAALIDEDK